MGRWVGYVVLDVSFMPTVRHILLPPILPPSPTHPHRRHTPHSHTHNQQHALPHRRQLNRQRARRGGLAAPAFSAAEYPLEGALVEDVGEGWGEGGHRGGEERRDEPRG